MTLPNFRTAILLCSLLLYLSPLAEANTSLFTPKQSTLIPADQAFVLTVPPGTQDTITLNWQIAPHTYLYQSKLEIVETTSAAIAPFSYDLPAGKEHDDPNFGIQTIYRNDLSVTLRLATSSTLSFPMQIQVNYQGCHNQGFCYPPQTAFYDVHYMNDQLVANPTTATNAVTTSSITSTTIPSLSTGLDTTQHPAHALFQQVDSHWHWLVFYLLGVLLGFTPCVLPMIPILMGIITGPALNKKRGHAFLLTLTYVLSIAVTYAFAGVITASLGASLQGYLQKPLFISVFALLFFYLGCTQLGWLRIGFASKFTEKLNAVQAKQQGGTYLSACILGILATLLASPCVTAPLVAILSFIAQTGQIGLGALSLFMLGLGMGTVLLIAGAIGSQYLPKAGPWMNQINHAVALMLFGLGLWMLGRFLPGTITLILWGLLCGLAALLLGTFRLTQGGISPRIGSLLLALGLLLITAGIKGHQSVQAWFTPNPQQHAVSSSIKTVTSLARLNDILATAQYPVLLDFYADWCVSCQHLERAVFPQPIVQAQLQRYTLVKIDVTAMDAEAKALLQHYQVIAPPTLIFIDEHPKDLSSYQHRIIGEISATTLAHRLAQWLSE